MTATKPQRLTEAADGVSAGSLGISAGSELGAGAWSVVSSRSS